MTKCFHREYAALFKVQEEKDQLVISPLGIPVLLRRIGNSTILRCLDGIESQFIWLAVGIELTEIIASEYNGSVMSSWGSNENKLNRWSSRQTVSILSNKFAPKWVDFCQGITVLLYVPSLPRVKGERNDYLDFHKCLEVMLNQALWRRVPAPSTRSCTATLIHRKRICTLQLRPLKKPLVFDSPERHLSCKE